MRNATVHKTTPGQRDTAIAIAIACLTGVAVLLTLAGHGAAEFIGARSATAWFLLGAVLATAALTGWVYVVLQRRARQAECAWATAWWHGIVLLAAVGFYFAVPLPSAFPPQAAQVVTLTATGEHVAESRSAEVWLFGLDHGERRVSLRGFEPGIGWEVRGRALVSYRNQPATIVWRGYLRPESELVLRRHAWSGGVRIAVDSEVRTLDLYAPESSEVRIPIGAGRAPSAAWQLSVAMADIWLLSIALWLVGACLLVRPDTAGTKEPPRWSWLAYGAPATILWSMYLIAFWPGCLTPDSIAQWDQMLSGNLLDDHPYVHTLTIWLITRLWLSPAVVAMVQIGVAAAVVGVALHVFRKAGVPAWACWGAAWLSALAPAQSILAVTLWKDLFFSAGLTLLTVLFAFVAVQQGRALRRIPVLAGLVLAGLLVALYRHNGWPVALGALVLLALVYRRSWPQMVVVLLLVGGTWYAAKGPVRAALGIARSPLGIELLMMHHVAAHVAAGTTTEPERAEMTGLFPDFDEWPYRADTSRPFLYGHARGMEIIGQNAEAIRRVFWSTAARRPDVNLWHVVRNAALVWRVQTPPGTLYPMSPVWRDGQELRYVARNTADLREASLSPQLAKWLARQGQWQESTWFTAVWWRNALWLYIALLAVVLAALRLADVRLLVVALPVLLNAAILVAGVPTNTHRYAFPATCIGMLLVVWPLLARLPRTRVPPQTQDTDADERARHASK
ncbi:MAG: hypothetical protein IPM18_02725 [Phycisphaerales bacterium]|nr:hypothetical protein [Phycisphaerales bacterium]